LKNWRWQDGKRYGVTNSRAYWTSWLSKSRRWVAVKNVLPLPYYIVIVDSTFGRELAALCRQEEIAISRQEI